MTAMEQAAAGFVTVAREGSFTRAAASLGVTQSALSQSIRGLEEIANAETNALDPETLATLRKNLVVIDQAITSGHAAAGAIELLRQAGARSVVVAAPLLPR